MFFVAPAAVILLTNTMFLFMTMCIVYRHSKYIPCRHAADNGGDIRTWVKGAMGLVCLLGVTWTCGLLWIDDGHSIVMAYAFTIANSLQGLFIFVFHVLCSEKMRYDIARWCGKHGLSCVSSSSRDTSRDLQKRGTMSPSERSGSEFIYPTSEKMHTSPRGLESSLSSAYPQQPLIHHYQRRPPQQPNGTYDYATIAYGEMVPGHMLPRMASSFPHPGVAIHYPSFDLDSSYQPQIFHHRPPPDFSPPPPPPAQGTTPSKVIRPPSSKMSDDSAYSDGGSSSVLTTEVTPSGATVLRMDLGRNQPPNYWRNV
ncbi:unnamed protein product [Haemonchus placei]|uniref:G-protein coupled receptors family 2 profile 2 domain-containing protein n=1 Tax=Haemonchus placei TaxID=6290 RepID=A0A3P7XXZ5_HAEPC|nr:unnamed protein product [Haemonchus placei]